MEENSNWFKLKVKYLVQTENKIEKKTAEFVLKGYTFSEAEANLTGFIEDTIGEFNLVTCSKFNIIDCIKDESKEFWYKVKVVYKDINEDNGKETRVIDNYLIQENNPEGITKKMKDRLTGSIMDYDLEQIQKTKISEVFYEVEK